MYYLLQRLPIIWWYTLCLIVGIVTGYYMQPCSFICFIGIITIALSWLAIYYPQFTKRSMLFIACSCLGYTLIYHQIHAHHTIITRYQNSPFSCTGTVIDYASTPHLPLRHKIVIALDSFHLDCEPTAQKISGYLLAVHTKQSCEYLVGSRIAIHNIALKPSSPSFTLFCIRNSLLGSVHKPVLAYDLISRPDYSLRRSVCTYRQRMIQFFKHHMDTKTFTLFSALFLGNNDLIKKTIKPYQKSFQNWGIIHYLARSGLHLVIVTILFEYLLYFISWSFTLGRIIILCCGLLYSCLTWASLSFYRALVLFLFCQSARIVRRSHHFLHTLLLTCFLFLIINPITLFFLDFQLTFGITLALSLFNYATFKPIT